MQKSKLFADAFKIYEGNDFGKSYEASSKLRKKN